jgi:hypothetical protein
VVAAGLALVGALAWAFGMRSSPAASVAGPPVAGMGDARSSAAGAGS